MKLAIAAALALAGAPGVAQTVAPAITTAVADAHRPAADRVRDDARKPDQFLAFAGVKPGDKVADFIMGGGYWTPLLADVVGARGKVYAYQPAEFIGYRAKYGTDQDAAVAGRANVVALRPSLGAIAFPEPLDLVITVKNWHDLHLAVSPAGLGAKVAAALFKALKPGGVLIVADNQAAAGTGFAISNSLHRAEGAAVRKEIEGAGFVYAGELPLWANPADDHSKLVFDPSIVGHEDQFVFKFRKPK